MVPAVEFRNVCKQFGAVQANQQVNLSIQKATIHGIVGENGAGKSTLMSILYGYYQADEGEIFLNGQPVRVANSMVAIAQGIGMVHQHFMLVAPFTVLENIMLGVEGSPILKGQFKRAEKRLQAIAQQYGLEVNPNARIEDLSVGSQQKVEILKLIYRGADILILDEPTAVLTPQETASLFEILRVFRDQGKTIILITHKLEEIFALTDRVTVMRAGRVVGDLETRSSSREEVAELMIGRQIDSHLVRVPLNPGRVVLEVKDLSLHSEQGAPTLEDINFSVRAGEIVAIAGVSGNGQTELLELLGGMRLPSNGDMTLMGTLLPGHKRKDAEGLPALYRALGIAHAPEDRLRHGLVKEHSVSLNAALGYQGSKFVSFGFFLNHRALDAHASQLIADFDIRPADARLRAGQLSGGNQQKLVLAREISSQPQLLLVGQPTRGVDIGAIETLHRKLLELRDQGVAILLVSVELEEIRALADRILVMCGGKITGELSAQEFDTTRIGLLMGGVST
jgi:simple sugar transport system ATP-binding protein